jgi:hypothetical protein
MEDHQGAVEGELVAASETERRWPPISRRVFIAGASAGLWLLIILAVLFTGVLRFLP